MDKVDFKFCLQWHAFEFEREGTLYKDLTKYGDPVFSNDSNCLSALVHFMLLEHLELIADDGGMTVLGNVLKDSPQHLQEPCLVALEMMKFGVLNGEPFDVASPDRQFPPDVNYPKAPVDQKQKSMLLLCRVMSLVPMKLRNDMWNADVDFDLAAFHSLVRVLKRALRHLTEASLTSVLLRDLTRVKLLPPGFMSAAPKKEDHMKTDALLPTFMLPRACMGIVSKFFLEYQGDAQTFNRELREKFPCCFQPKEDLKVAFTFWEDLRRCVDEIAEPLGAEDLAEDMKHASTLLAEQQWRLHMFDDDSSSLPAQMSAQMQFHQQQQHHQQQAQHHQMMRGGNRRMNDMSGQRSHRQHQQQHHQQMSPQQMQQQLMMQQQHQQQLHQQQHGWRNM